MRHLIIIALFFTSLSQATAQNYDPTPEQIEAKRRFERTKIRFLEKQYEDVLSYYDSILTQSKYTRIETYKMASESCLELAKRDSTKRTKLSNKSEQIYLEAIKWHGKMLVEEKWDSLKIEVSKEPEIFKVVEQQPEFPGGMPAFYRYVGHEMRYPAEARRMGTQGRVYVQFVVNKDGSIDAVNAVQGIGGGCDEEAVRVIKNAPNFTPGSQDGEPVYVKMVMPIIFKLAGKPPKKKKKKKRD